MIDFHNYPPTDASDAYITRTGMSLLLAEDNSVREVEAYGRAAATELVDAFSGDREIAVDAAQHLAESQISPLLNHEYLTTFFSGSMKKYVRDTANYVGERVNT